MGTASPAHGYGPARGLLACMAAFCSGAALLALELLAAGWMAPLFGSGMDVWAAVLGVTLSAMVLGYAAGSLSAGRWASPRSLSWLYAVAGLAALICTALVRGWVRPGAELVSPGWTLGAAALLLAAPVACLAAGSPWLVEILSTRTGAGAGRASGITYAASTLGGVLGALAAGMWMIPALGLWNSALIAAWTLTAAALVCVLLSRKKRLVCLIAAAVLTLATLAGHFLPRWIFPAPTVGGRRAVLREDSWYGRREVFEDEAKRYLFVNGVLQTAAPRFGGAGLRPGALLAGGNALELLPYLRPDARRALVIGLGGGLVSGHLAGRGLEVESVEIDPGVARIARKHFGFEGKCHVEDGRRFLNRVENKYDFIVLDVYRGEELPVHLATREFFALVRRRLVPGGIFAMNLIGAAGTPDTGALLGTAGSVFPRLMLFAPGEGGALGPMTLLAADSELLHPSTRDRLRERGLELPARVSLENFNPRLYPLLTDDRNPLRILRRPVARAWRAAALAQQRPKP